MWGLLMKNRFGNSSLDNYNSVFRYYKEHVINDHLITESISINNEVDLWQLNLVQRDFLYTDLLKAFLNLYKTRHSKKEHQKLCFFITTIICFFLFIVGVSVSLITLSIRSPLDLLLSLLPTYITAIAGGISAIILIPISISRYLFNPDEDTAMLKMIKKMQDHDLQNTLDLRNRQNTIQK